MSKLIKNKRNKKDNNLKYLYLKKYDKKIDIEIADDFFSRLIGLMFRENAKFPLLFEIPQKSNSRKRSSIHSFFMRFEIILVFIDKNNIVFEITALRPWKYYVPKKPAKYIIEFDSKEYDNLKLEIGDEIVLK